MPWIFFVSISDQSRRELFSMFALPAGSCLVSCCSWFRPALCSRVAVGMHAVLTNVLTADKQPLSTACALASHACVMRDNITVPWYHFSNRDSDVQCLLRVKLPHTIYPLIRIVTNIELYQFSPVTLFTFHDHQPGSAAQHQLS